MARGVAVVLCALTLEAGVAAAQAVPSPTVPASTPMPAVPPAPPAWRRGARRPYTLNPLVDGAVLAATASLWLGPEFMHHELVPLGRCPCDPSMLNDLDRSTAGINVPNVAVPSNVATGLLIMAPVVFDAFDVWRSHGSMPEWIEDSLVIGEALVVGGALNEIVKLTFQRPRPGLYGVDPGAASLQDPESYLSFYSLSAAEVFTALAAGTMTFALRHPHSPWRWVYLGAAGLLASGFGVSRFLLGKHFPSDVLTAAAVGTLVGVGIPLLHTRSVPLTLGAAAGPGGAMLTATLVTR